MTLMFVGIGLYQVYSVESYFLKANFLFLTVFTILLTEWNKYL